MDDLAGDAVDEPLTDKAIAGDCNSDGHVDIADAIFLVNWLFIGGDSPECLGRCDYMGDGKMPDLGDFMAFMDYHLRNVGSAPMLPMEVCDGIDNNCDGNVDEGCLISGGYSIKVVWNEVAEDVYGNPMEISEYRVHYGRKPNLYANSLDTSSSSAVIDGLLPGLTYYIAVSAIDSRGNESRLSDEIQVQQPY